MNEREAKRIPGQDGEAAGRELLNRESEKVQDAQSDPGMNPGFVQGQAGIGEAGGRKGGPQKDSSGVFPGGAGNAAGSYAQNRYAGGYGAPIPPKYQQPQGGQRVRRVGTVTMGLTLIGAGILFLASLFFRNIDLSYWLKFSPVVLIVLGVEVLVFNFGYRNEKLKYDFLSIILCFFLLFVSLGVVLSIEGYEYAKKHVFPQWGYTTAVTEVTELKEGESIRFVQGNAHRGDGDVTYVIKTEQDGTETVLYKGVSAELFDQRLDELSDTYEENLDELQNSYEDQIDRMEKEQGDLQDQQEEQTDELVQNYEKQLEDAQRSYEELQDEYERQLEELTESYERQLEELEADR